MGSGDPTDHGCSMGSLLFIGENRCHEWGTSVCYLVLAMLDRCIAAVRNHGREKAASPHYALADWLFHGYRPIGPGHPYHAVLRRSIARCSWCFVNYCGPCSDSNIRCLHRFSFGEV